MAFAQDNNLFPQENVMNLTHTRSIGQMEKLRLINSSWLLDSSWYSQWITSTQQWNLFQREFVQYNNNFQMVQDLFVIWNPTASQWQNSNRTVNLYNGSGNFNSINGQVWYPAGSYWVTNNYMHFNDQGRVDTNFNKTYDPLSNSFTSGYMKLTFYNSSYMVSEAVTLTLDTLTGNWINSMREQYTYNASSQLTEYQVQLWNTGLNDWVGFHKTTHSYDASGYATGYIIYVWNIPGSQWIPSTQLIFTNNSSGLKLLCLQQQWMAATSSWRNESQLSYQYNTNNYLSDILSQNWDTLSSSWINFSKDHYDFFTNNYIKTHFQWYWNPLNSTWMDTGYSLNDSLTGTTLENYSKTLDLTTYTYLFGYRYVYTYNVAGQCTEYEHFNLNISSGVWEPSGKRLYTYDINGNNTIQLDQTYNTATLTWDNYFKLENFYSIPTGITERSPLSSVCVFANPLHQGEAINCPNLSYGNDYMIILFSLNGQSMFHSAYHAGEALRMPAGLASGMYLLQILDQGQLITSGKVILKD